MKPTTFLRIASIITLFYFAGHTSGMPWVPDVYINDGAFKLTPVIEAMRDHKFEIVGSTRSYWEFYQGFGITISLFLLMQAIVLWQLGSMAKTDARAARPILASFLVAFTSTPFWHGDSSLRSL